MNRPLVIGERRMRMCMLRTPGKRKEQKKGQQLKRNDINILPRADAPMIKKPPSLSPRKLDPVVMGGKE